MYGFGGMDDIAGEEEAYLQQMFASGQWVVADNEADGAPSAELGCTEAANKVFKALHQQSEGEPQGLRGLVANEHCYVLTELVKDEALSQALQNYLEAIGVDFRIEEDCGDLVELFCEALFGLKSDAFSSALKLIDAAKKTRNASNLWYNGLGMIYQSQTENALNYEAEIIDCFRGQACRELETYKAEPSDALADEVHGTMHIIGQGGIPDLVTGIWRQQQDALETLYQALNPAYLAGKLEEERDLADAVILEILLRVRPNEAESYAAECLPDHPGVRFISECAQFGYSHTLAMAILLLSDEDFEDAWESLPANMRTKALDVLTRAPAAWLKDLSTEKKPVILKRELQLCQYSKHDDPYDRVVLNSESISSNELLTRLSGESKERYLAFLHDLPSVLACWSPNAMDSLYADCSDLQRLQWAILSGADFITEHPETTRGLTQAPEPTRLLDLVCQTDPGLMTTLLDTATKYCRDGLAKANGILKDLGDSVEGKDESALREALASFDGAVKELGSWRDFLSSISDYKLPFGQESVQELVALRQSCTELKQASIDPRGVVQSARTQLRGEPVEGSEDESEEDFSHPKYQLPAAQLTMLARQLGLENPWEVPELLGLVDEEDFQLLRSATAYLNQDGLIETWQSLHAQGLRSLKAVIEGDKADKFAGARYE